MKKRLRRGLALMLSAALALSMNVTAFADEVQEDAFETAGAEAEEEVKEARVTEDMLLAADEASSATPYTVSADKTLSENAEAISDNLAEQVVSKGVTGDKYTFFVVHPQAIAFDGKNKPGSKKAATIPVQVFYADKSKNLSANDLYKELSGDNKNGYSVSNESVFSKAETKKVKIKAAKGATVDLTGKALYPVAKSTFISGIKLVNKDLDKELKKVIKDPLKATKKNKTSTVSAGAADDYVISVYPAYIGNDKTGQEVAKEIGLTPVTPSFEKTKYKSNVPTKITTTAAGKKVTLKPTKKTGKYKGYKSSAEPCTADTNSLKATYYVEADGNFAGNIYFDPK